MEKKKKETLDEILHEIEKNKEIIFIQDIVAFVAISMSTLYEYFPAPSEEMAKIKEAINKNKINIKMNLRRKMETSDNPTAMLALYRLTSTPEEHRLLNQQYVENNVKTEKPILLDFSDLDNDTNEGN